MNRLDRALGIVLALRGGKEVSAQQLAQRFEVSPDMAAGGAHMSGMVMATHVQEHHNLAIPEFKMGSASTLPGPRPCTKETYRYPVWGKRSRL